MKLVMYKDNIWGVINEFMSGNGTYDIMMYELKSFNKNETVTMPMFDVEELDNYLTDGIKLWKKCSRENCGLEIINEKSSCICDYLVSEHEISISLQSLDINKNGC
jgi:hypothetical protein